MQQKPRVAFYTLGCKVNQYDTQAFKEKFINKGYKIVDFNKEADVYIVNTCSVTSLADRKSRQVIRKAYKQNKNALIVAAGCYTQLNSEKLLDLPGVRLAVGTKDRLNIVKYVNEIINNKDVYNRVVSHNKDDDYEELTITSFEERTRATLKVQEGCNRFCTYCIIPYTRGRIKSRKVEDAVNEAKRLANAGYREIVITGIHLGSYGIDLENETYLIDLLKRVHEIKDIYRIRLGSLEPNIVDKSFVNELIKLPKICRHFHMSLQSGSNHILKKMGRRYSIQDFLRSVDMLRNSLDNVSITTDIIVGFPGETDKDFKNTINFVEQIRFSRIHVFKFSPREGTPAARLTNQINNIVKDKRSNELITIAETLQKQFIKSYMDKELSVLFERNIKIDESQYYEGYSNNYIRVLCKTNRNILGKIFNVKIVGQKQDYALGILI